MGKSFCEKKRQITDPRRKKLSPEQLDILHKDLSEEKFDGYELAWKYKVSYSTIRSYARKVGLGKQKRSRFPRGNQEESL